jgi:hypothetical protein
MDRQQSRSVLSAGFWYGYDTMIVKNMDSTVRRVEIVAECLLAYSNEPQTYIHRGITYPENICLVENKHDFLRQEYSFKGKNTPKRLIWHVFAIGNKKWNRC